MASIRKRQWFTTAELEKIRPEAERRAIAAGKGKWTDYRDEVAASLEIKPSKAWVVAYRDQHKKRVLKTFPTEKEAKAWSVNALHEVQLGTHSRASASKTVAEAWLLWLEQGEADGLEFGTTLARKQHLKVHVEPSIGHLRLANLTTPLLYDFDKKLRDKGTSIAMRRKILTSSKTMLSFAQGRGLVAQNVARGVRIKSDARESSRGPLRAGVDFPTMAELNALREFHSTPQAVYRHRNLYWNAAQ